MYFIWYFQIKLILKIKLTSSWLVLYNILENRAVSTVWGRPSNRYGATAFGCDFDIGRPVGRLCLQKIRNTPIKKKKFTSKRFYVNVSHLIEFNFIGRKSSWALIFNLKWGPFRMGFLFLFYIFCVHSIIRENICWR